MVAVRDLAKHAILAGIRHEEGDLMAVAELRITKREPYLDGRSFGNTSSYERIDGVLTYAVDPEDSANASIVD